MGRRILDAAGRYRAERAPGHALAYDSQRKRVVLFGGAQVPDTW
jgi:hypothetical protein